MKYFMNDFSRKQESRLSYICLSVGIIHSRPGKRGLINLNCLIARLSIWKFEFEITGKKYLRKDGTEAE